MTLEDLTPWLFSRTTGGIRWGLDRTLEMLAGVDDPHRRFDSVHIGGTNGKGSVAALCDAALRSQAARRIGLYTSPHLVSFSERIRIDGAPVSDAQLLSAAERLRPHIERTGASFFEATTAIAFLCFADAGVELAVVEVGLGGRLDATNVLEPLLTAVTNVGWDHMDYLGDSLTAIAREKAGIFKRGVPALTAEADPDLLRVLRQEASEAGTRLQSLDEICRLASAESIGGVTRLAFRSQRLGDRDLTIALAGEHQVRNALLAAELLGALPTAMSPDWSSLAAGFAAARWPGRLQIERLQGTTWIFDVAHNAAGAAALASSIRILDPPRPVVLVAGILGDKEWREMLLPLVDVSDGVVLTVPESAPPARRWDPEAVGRWVAATTGAAPRVIPEMEAALERARTLAPHGTILVTGSVHTVGDAMKALSIPTAHRLPPTPVSS